MPVPGAEGIQTWNALIAMSAQAGTRLDLWPRYELDFEIGGLRDAPETEDNREVVAGRHGERLLKALRRGKPLTLKGTIRARTLPELLEAEGALTAAFVEGRDGTMVATPHPAIGGSSYSYEARCTALQIIAASTTHRFQSRFLIGLRMHDARFYEMTEVRVQSAALTAQAGLELPLELPVEFPGADLSSATVTVTNTGTAPTDRLVLELYGPTDSIELYNDSLGTALLFEDLALTAEQLLLIDFDPYKRTVLLEGVSDYDSRRSIAESTWWQGDTPALGVGVNTLRYRVTNSDGAPATAYGAPINLLPNPRIATAVTDYAGVGASIVYTPDDGGAALITRTTTGIGNYDLRGPTPRIAVEAGKTYTGSGYVKLLDVSRTVQARISWFDGASATISQPFAASVVPLDGGYARVSVTGVAPANAVTAQVIIQPQAAAAGERALVQRLMLNEGALIDYFDGSYLNKRWSGAAHASTSESATAFSAGARVVAAFYPADH